MKTIAWVTLAVLVQLLAACATSDALLAPTSEAQATRRVSRPSPSPTPLDAPATLVPTEGRAETGQTPTAAAEIPIPKSDASLFAYRDGALIWIAGSDGEIGVPVAWDAQGADYSSVSAFDSAESPADASIVYVTGMPSITYGTDQSNGPGETLWIYHPDTAPEALVTTPADIESVAISPDGSLIAYSLLYWPHDAPEEDWYEQLWVVGADGIGNRLVSDRTGDYIVDPGPFRLAPVAWSADSSKVYLTTNTDSEATPKGLYVASLASGRIEKAKTPQETLWDAVFSADRSRVAYSSFQWVPVEGYMPEIGPPYAIKVTELATGETVVVWESDTDFVSDPVWSPDEGSIAFSKDRNSLAVVDLASGVAKVILVGEPEMSVRPLAWLSDGRIVAIFGDRVMSLRVDGAEPVHLPFVKSVLGELP